LALIPRRLPVITATGTSPDGALSVSADLEGNLTLATSGGRLIGRAAFASRHDFVRFVWFPAPRELGVQTARGAMFTFSIGS
ncbi:MAG: hypothetical protein ACRETX_14400, partial [Steroidobacteraceae bacterium]